MAKKHITTDVPQEKHIPTHNIIGRIRQKIRGDLNAESATTEEGFPWTFADATKRPIGSMFDSEITTDMLKDMYRRYQLARRIVDAPVEDAFAVGFRIEKKNGDAADPDIVNAAIKEWNIYKSKWNRFFKLVNLFGRCEMIFGWTDPRENWRDLPPKEDSTFTWLQPVPIDNEVELKISETIPIRIEKLSVNFGGETISLHRSRFIHAMNPKLIDEDKDGETVLSPIYNLLQVQIHADWSIGQALFRRASGLLGIYAPKGNITDMQRSGAIGSVSNHNSKTALYIPFGWNVKDILKPGGNLAIARTYKVMLEQIAAGSEFPVSVLIGQQKSSLNLTGDDLIIYERKVRKFQENTMAPTLQKFFRICQEANKIPAGELYVVPNPMLKVDSYQQEKEETIIGAMRLLKARMESATDETGNITEPFAEGLPDNTELIKFIGTFKDRTKNK
ncbi:MAG: hypothetical protein DRP09_10605 [Candidatus Thorarchaeota archaeon]|nr:MAG: hypothetical protein DRP09_10605 [Candidatus Thorarchaeota archaeon]